MAEVTISHILPCKGRGTMRNMVEGYFPCDGAIPLHQLTAGPPPPPGEDLSGTVSA